MQNYLKFCLFFLTALTINAETINLRGKITNMAGNPVTNAIVTLVNQGLKDTTGADGAYSILSGTPVVSPIALVPRLKTIVLEKGILEYSLPDPSPVKIEIFNVKGNLLKRDMLPNASKGFYNFNIEENLHGAQLLIIRTSIGHDAFTFRYLPFKGLFLVDQSNENSISVGGTLAKINAISDTIKVSAAGFNPKTVAITSYDQEVNISLDSSNAKRSSGCGKTTTAYKGQQIYHISSGGQTREYIVRIPDDYNPNTPYKLWFSFHPMGGTDTGVADGSTIARGGSANTHYEFYGIWKFANPDSGKGTTIFCSPQGIGNMWSNGGGSDVEFVRELIKKFESELCIDESRIFSEGFSMGGSMTYALSCAMPDTFRAVCMHSGGSMSGCDGSHRGPVPMFITHGTDDPRCTWPGSGVPQINDLAQRDGCTTEDLAAECHPVDQIHPICINYKNCKTGYPCKACIFKGGHDPSPGNDPPGNTWGELTTWVDDSTWSYFKQFY